ncbi:G-protein coupled receptor-associated protein LMBRD2-like [Babylonia areolata]|uniref:G-protein coupled receptor-associated protein LMBRD2-like n=1 Tax=Babylonia areolata TaxID=304850 RepID=UPI003FD68FFC
MSAGPLVVEIICTCMLAAFLLHRYGDLRKQHVLVTLATFIAWYFSLMIIFILPLDVSLTFYRQCLFDNAVSTTTTTTTTVTPNNHTHPPTPTLQPAPLVRREVNGNGSVNVSSPVYVEGASSLGGKVEDVGLVCEQPLSYVSDSVLPALWRVIYWTSQVLTWLILPMMQSYSNAGDFTVLGKVKSALIENAIFYGTYLLIFGICLIYVAARPDLDIDGEKLKIIGVTASNTWGLFVLVLMLGYGLVEVPRSMWNNAKRGHKLSATYFKVAKLSTEKTEAEEALEDVLEEIRRCADKIRYNSPLRPHMDTVLSKCPESTRRSLRTTNLDDYEDYGPSSSPDLSVATLVKLHKKVMRSLQLQRRTQIQWNNLMSQAFHLEEVEENMRDPHCCFKSSSSSSSSSSSQSSVGALLRVIYTPTIEWYWKCRVQAYFYMGLSLVLMVLSFMVVWSECLFFIKSPTLSLFAVFINLARHNYDYAYIELASILTIAYLCFCAYYSVFKIRILNYYYIAPHHQTNEHSLIFTGMMLCRLTPPMCLNFLGLIHLDSHVTRAFDIQETSYTKIMGHMDVISIISDGFNIYFPILIVLLCICTYFSLGSRLLSLLGFQQFIGDDDMTSELVDEGRELVKRERRKQERKAEGDSRRKMWTERFGNGSTTSSKDVPAPGERAEKYSVARSPDESDRTELLRQVEPIDYTEDRGADLLTDYTRSLGSLGSSSHRPSSSSSASAQQGYQAQGSRFGSSRSSSSGLPGKPPRGIFDDV